MLYQFFLAHFGKIGPLAGTSTRQQISLPLVFLGLFLGLCEAHTLQRYLQGGGHARVVMYVHAIPLCKPGESLKVGGSGNVLPAPPFNGGYLFRVSGRACSVPELQTTPVADTHGPLCRED